MSQTQAKPRMNDIVLMRVFAILGVVAFHVYQMTYTAGHFPENIKEVLGALYFLPISCVLINIAMPLFLAISGYLFYWQLQRGKLTTWREMLAKKAQRIIVPYLAFSVVMLLTTGHFTEFNSWIPVVRGGYWHLWFLPALLWCFITGYALKTLMVRWWGASIILVVSFIVQCMPKFLPPLFGLYNLTPWFLWFALGGVILLYKTQIYNVLHHIYIYINKYLTLLDLNMLF